MRILNKISSPQAQKVRFTDAKMYVLLTDGRELGVPLEWFAKPRDATGAQRINWHLIGGGIGIHCKDIDEDLSVAGLL